MHSVCRRCRCSVCLPCQLANRVNHMGPGEFKLLGCAGATGFAA
jgi:hypothetical protein